ncbi:MAG: hypothetical protein ACK4UU_01045 [Fimbriimonadales bacterium]
MTLRNGIRYWLIAFVVIYAGAWLLVPIGAQIRQDGEAACADRVRTLVTAMLMYLQDYDEVMPLAFGRTTDGVWLWNQYHPVPADWNANQLQYREAYASMWANALSIYLPVRGPGVASRYDWLLCPSVRLQRLGNYTGVQKRPASVSYTYNGLLHRLEVGRVAAPHLVPLLWEGRGRDATYGYALSNPVLRCTSVSNCQYRPYTGGECSPRGVMFGLLGSAWIHPRGVAFAFVDGHVAYRRLGLVVGANTNYNYDPFTNYDSNGIPQSHWTDGCNPWLFRPYTQ